MPDCLAATYQLMMADSASLSQVHAHASYTHGLSVAFESKPWSFKGKNLVQS